MEKRNRNTPAFKHQIALSLQIQLPEWVEDFLRDAPLPTDDKGKMRLAIELSRQNVLRGSGGPFGAAVFSIPDGHLVSVGINSVERLHNSVLHAEVMALMLAEKQLTHYSLHGDAGHSYELFSSCEPCAMCLGAVLWSGVSRVVCAASKQDALELGFDEGPVYPESYTHLEERGIRIEHGLLADEAKAILGLYLKRDGLIYNAK